MKPRRPIGPYRLPRCRARSRRRPAPPRRPPPRSGATGRGRPRSSSRPSTGCRSPRRPLVEQGVADRTGSDRLRAGGAGRAARRKESPITSGRARPGGDPSAPALAQQFEHGPVELDDLPVARSAQTSQARRGARRQRLAGAVDAPGAGHAQMRVDHQAAGETDQQVLAVGVDGVAGTRRAAPASGHA